MMWRSWRLAVLIASTAAGALAKSQSNAAAFQSVELLGRQQRRATLPRGVVPVFAAGGFGTSSTSTAQSKKKKTHGKKRKILLDEDVIGERAGSTTNNSPSSLSSSSSSSSPPPPQLDKWGLPIPTDDDIFPRMPRGTEFIAVDKDHDHDYSLGEIKQAVRPHLEFPGLERFFDEQGVERPRNHPDAAAAKSIMKLRLVHQSPPILTIENFLTKEECEQVQATASATTPSNDGTKAYQVNSATFAKALSRRTSTSWFCHYSQVPTLLAKMHHILGIPLEQMEEPQVVRYQAGQEFSWHYDEVPPPQLDNGGQRLATFLLYLKDVAPGGGGGTVFRDLRKDYTPDDGEPLTVRPKQGMACIFFPAFADGQADDRTLHKGEVLAPNTEKWISQIWIHERTYQPVLPPGNSHQAARNAIQEASRRLGFTDY